MTETETQHTGVKVASTIALLAGIWLFISPWIYGAYMEPNAWNSWIVGVVMIVLATIHLSSPMDSWTSWLNCLLGIWTFASPWIYGYTVNTGRLINSLCVGVIVFIVALSNVFATPHTDGPMPTRV